MSNFKYTEQSDFKIDRLSELFEYFHLNTSTYFEDEEVSLKKHFDKTKHELSIGSACRLKTSQEYNEVWDSYFKFAFVRNSWDRMVSSWQMQMPNISFSKFLKMYPYKDDTDLIWHTLPMWIHIYDNQKNILVDFIGRFENLQEDFNTVCDKIGIPRQELPHKNKNKHKHYTEYYDDETREIVAEKYAKDIEYFGYEFGE